MLDVNAPGSLSSWRLTPLTEPYATDPSLSQSRPDAVRVGERIYVAWESESPSGDARMEQVWLQELNWSSGEPDVIQTVNEWRLPVTAESLPEQRRPVLGASPLFPGGALIAVWEDHSGSVADRPLPDLMLSFRPVPFVLLNEADASGPGS